MQKNGDDKGFYKECIRRTIQRGGDTDTNAAIVGGMIGALVGTHNLDESMVSKVLTFDCVNPAPHGNPRPDFLSAKRYLLKTINGLL